VSTKKELIALAEDKAHFLAKKYNNSGLYNDLVQEGLLAALEALEQGVEDEKKVFGVMRRRMNDFYNFGQLPVYVPPSGTSRKGLSLFSGDEGSQGMKWPLLQALMASDGASPFEDTNLPSITDHVKEYEATDYLQHLMFILEEELTDREYDMVVSYYLHEVPQGVIAEKYGVHQQHVSRIVEGALEKVRYKLSE